MEVPALCTHMLMNLFVLLAPQPAQSHEPTFPTIIPDRLQFLEYESVSVGCELIDGMKTWRVKQKLHEVDQELSTETCNPSAPSCTIYPILEQHSGEYWCENDEGGKTNTVNISVTAGLVILDVPARPVMEGSNLTLWCTNKKTGLKHISDFYKDGVLLSTSYRNNFSILNISKSDEGRYKCTISGGGESPESWLIVSKQVKGLSEETQQMDRHFPTITLLCCVASVALLLLMSGLVLYRKHKASADPPNQVIYAVVNKKKKREPEISTSRVREEDVIYSFIN